MSNQKHKRHKKRLITFFISVGKINKIKYNLKSSGKRIKCNKRFVSKVIFSELLKLPISFYITIFSSIVFCSGYAFII